MTQVGTIAAWLLVALMAGSAIAEETARVAGLIGGDSNSKKTNQLYWVPVIVDGASTDDLMQMRVCRLNGDKSTSIAVINHGSPSNSSQRPTMKTTSCDAEVTKWFRSRGYAVAYPLRRGYGETGGKWAEEYGSCSRPSFGPAGLATADDIDSAVRYLTTLPFVRKDRVLVVGQSAGGWGTLAYASRNPDYVWGMINFAGGRGGQQDGVANKTCNAEELVTATGRYGAKARKPLLWITTENDHFFDPKLVARMHEAFVKGGGIAHRVLLPAFAKDGHTLFFGKGGSDIWGKYVSAYLETLPQN
jgi:dienelactone hydrolase